MPLPAHVPSTFRPSADRKKPTKNPFKVTKSYNPKRYQKSSSSAAQALRNSNTGPPTTINPLKKRRRDLLRLLSHSAATTTHNSAASTYTNTNDNHGLPADTRVAYERELAFVDTQIEEAEQERLKKKMIGKYHMVRFFERKKATRLLKSARRKLADADAGKEAAAAALEAEIHAREVDLNYTLYYPLNAVYVSLYASPTTVDENGVLDSGSKKRKRQAGAFAPDDAENDKSQDKARDVDTTVNRNDPHWKLVEEAMASGGERQLRLLREGTLTRETRNGGSSSAATLAKQARAAGVEKAKNSATRKANGQKTPQSANISQMKSAGSSTTKSIPQPQHPTSLRPKSKPARLPKEAENSIDADAEQETTSQKQQHFRAVPDPSSRNFIKPPKRTFADDYGDVRDSRAEWRRQQRFGEGGNGRVGENRAERRRQMFGGGGENGYGNGRQDEEGEEEDDGTGTGFFE